MKTSAFAFLAMIAALPLSAAVQTWTNVPLIDQKCSTKFTPSTVGTHTRGCAIACQSSGYGILTSDGAFLKFDKDSSQKALDELKSSKAKDHLHATVTGELEGNTVKVQSIKLD